MKAAVHTRYGPPSVLRLAEIPRPVPGDHDILVRVRATTVNRTDTGFRLGEPWIVRLFAGLFRPRQPVLGSEFSGVVEAVGRAARLFRPGDEVFGLTAGCAMGCHAQFVCLAEAGSVARKPANMSHEQAVSLCDGAHLALSLLDNAGLRKGQRVLVYGASGSIGSAAVQLAKAAGLWVTAVSQAHGLDAVRALGPDEVVDCDAQDFTRLPMQFDLVLDAVGKSSYGRCKGLLAPGGLYISTDFGDWCQNIFYSLWFWLAGSRRVRFPLPSHAQKEIIYFRGLAEAGALRPVIDRRYPLEHIAQAHAYVETGRKVGNVVITMDA